MKGLRESKNEGDGNRPNVKNDYVTAYRQIREKKKKKTPTKKLTYIARKG